MAELLLRGEQSLGDLRARSSRMKKIESLSELKPVIASLVEKNLVVELTPAGRGQMVTHNLYKPEELERVRSEFERGATDERRNAGTAKVVPDAASRATPVIPATGELQSRVKELESEVAALKEQLDRLSSRLDELTG